MSEVHQQCPRCRALLFGYSAEDLAVLVRDHDCQSWTDRHTADMRTISLFHQAGESQATRNQTFGFDVPVDPLKLVREAWEANTDAMWQSSITVEDARFLAAMKIDPL